VWAFLPATASASYSHSVRKAAHDAAEAALGQRANSADAAVAIRQLTGWLAARHGPGFVHDVAGELAEMTSALTTEEDDRD